MEDRRWILFSSVLMTTLFVRPLSALSASQQQPPHIVFIVADDLGWNDVGWRDPNMYTPNLDRLARAGTILSNSYVQPLCSPTRSAILSGYFPYHIGRQKAFLSPALKLLPEALREFGYATHMVGKWHLGYCNWQYTPTFRGFDTFYGFYNGEGAYDFRRDEAVSWEDAGKYSTSLFADRAMDVLMTHDKSQPLFLYLPFQAPHFPLQVPNYYEDEFCSHIQDTKRRTYCGMVAMLDEAVGNITDLMETLGYMNNTLLVFTSDNGGRPEDAGNNWPLRGAKGTLWEGGTRGTGFIYSRTLLPNQGTVHEGLMHAVDWFPTIMSLVGGMAPIGIDGVSQWESIVTGSESPRTEFVYNIDEIDNNAAIRLGDWKLIEGSPGDFNDWYPPPDDDVGQTTAIHDAEDTVSARQLRLFNIKDDPTERNDVKDEYPEVLAEMKERLRKWRESLVPANFPPDDPAADPNNFDGVWSPGWC
ncbi:hypothetical protein BaRGS_00008329 [Batillaria attramentaria]|uniref:Sulfatase N-terminal domain-containing protein n=1 Tax=Batillaria attramentaria TaxID=370345 RepID=A0ABD0LM38_9CAEN